MNRLQDLINRLCPDGVPFKPLWELTYWDKKFNGVERNKQPKVINYPYLLAKDMKALESDKGDVTLLSTGEYVGKTTEEIAGKYLCDGEVVTMPWGGTVKGIKYHKGKFVTADNRIATSRDTSVLNNKFLYYIFLHQSDLIQSFYRGAGIQHPNMYKVLNMIIPVPPIEVQEEIVKILDRFADYAAELQAELQARKEQYEYYRNLLLTFSPSACGLGTDDKQEDSVTNWGGHSYKIKWKKIMDICNTICSGGTPKTSNKSFYQGSIPWMRTQEVDWSPVYDTSIKISNEALLHSSAKMIPKNCVIVAMYGATAAKCCINKIPLSTNQACCNLEINPEKAKYKYVYYFLCKEYHNLKNLGEGSQNNISSNKIKNYLIPIPPIELQEKIVSILDKFETLVNDLTEGLPAEIEAVKERYEYYRNRLLTFKQIS